MLKRSGLLAVCMVILLLQGACTSGTSGIHHCSSGRDDCGALKTHGRRPTPSPPAPQRHRIRFGVVGSPATLDPYSPLASALTYELAVPVYPSLFRFDPEGRAHPYLARSLHRLPHGARIELRRARWSNGRRVSARDVVRSWRRAAPPSGFARIGSAHALGPRVVQFKGRVRDWAQALATVGYVLPKGRAKRVSAGPFLVRSYAPGHDLVFERNRGWWGRPRLKEVKVEFVQNLQVLLLLLRSGSLDAAAPPSSVNLDYRLHALGLDHSDALGWESIQLHFSGGRLDNNQRLALAAAVNRARLARAFVNDEGRPSTTLHPGPHGAAGPWSRPLSAGGPIHERVLLAAPDGDELLGLVQRALQIQLASVASDVELVTIDPQTFYGPWQHQGPADVLLDRSAGAPGLAGGGKAYRQGRALPLFEVETVLAWRPGLTGLRANPTFDGPLWNAATWSA